MATHNQVRVVGFLLNDPHIVNEGMQGAERIVYQVRTVHRDLDGFNGAKFQDLVVFYAGEEYIYNIITSSDFTKYCILNGKNMSGGYVCVPAKAIRLFGVGN